MFTLPWPDTAQVFMLSQGIDIQMQFRVCLATRCDDGDLHGLTARQS